MTSQIKINVKKTFEKRVYQTLPNIRIREWSKHVKAFGFSNVFLTSSKPDGYGLYMVWQVWNQTLKRCFSTVCRYFGWGAPNLKQTLLDPLEVVGPSRIPPTPIVGSKRYSSQQPSSIA